MAMQRFTPVIPSLYSKRADGSVYIRDILYHGATSILTEVLPSQPVPNLRLDLSFLPMFSWQGFSVESCHVLLPRFFDTSMASL